MKKYLVLALISAFVTPAYAAVNWHGSTEVRYSNTKLENNLNTTDATNGASTAEQTTRTWDARVALGASGGWDNIEWGTSVLTGITTTPNGSYTTYNTVSAAGGFALAIDSAWFSYSNNFGFGDLKVIFGRQAPAFDSGRTQLFMDTDTYFDGFGWQWMWGSFGFNANQYVLGANNQSRTAGASTQTETPATEKQEDNISNFQVLYSFQPWMKWRFTDDISMKLSAAYHNWDKTIGTTNTIPNANGGGIGAANSTAQTINMDNARQWHFLVDFTLPMTFMFDFEYIMNKDTTYSTAVAAEETAWAASLSYGKVKKAHDFMIGYSYAMKGLASVVNRYSNDKHAAGLDGHTVWLKYAVANNMNLGFKWISLEEDEPRNAAGARLATTEKIDSNFWSVSAGVMF